MVRAIVGANWGDEGKGKITDMLGEKSDIIVRFQGGSNAGHTIINEYGKFALHLLPSGVFYQHTLLLPFLQKCIDHILNLLFGIFRREIIADSLCGNRHIHIFLLFPD